MTKQRLDITGQRYGRLTVIKEVKSDTQHSRWLCRCDCGNEITTYMNRLRNGSAKSCGCLRKERSRQATTIDLTGKRFGKLMVLDKTQERNKSGHIFWLCECDCGVQKNISSNHLINGTTKSCGCLRSEKGEEIRGSRQKHYKDGVYVPNLKSKINSNNSTGFKGVYAVHKKSGIKYRAVIWIKKKTINLGTYDTLEEAVKARKEGEERYHQPFLNE